jgi:ABC-type Fe3+-hydroxamate transport system substrate-binding protein
MTLGHNLEEININCIYIPFPADTVCNYNNYYENIKYFTYDPVTKKIITFIELFLKIMNENKELIFVETISDTILKNLYQKNIYDYVRGTKNDRVISTEEYDWLDNNIRTPLLMDYFNKLFEPNMNKNKLLSIDNYEIYNKVKEKFKPNN